MARSLSFKETNTKQQISYYELAVAAFSTTLSEIDFLGREEYLAQRPLTYSDSLCWCYIKGIEYYI